MGLPFKSGADLASALGYGEMYQAAERKDMEDEQNAMSMRESVKGMMNKMDEIFKRNIQDVID